GAAAEVVRGSATKLALKDCTMDAVVTDPPYYDNVPYADLADFFYVWLKRSIGVLYPEHFASELSPKKSEIVAFGHRYEGGKEEAKANYERMMEDALRECHRVLKAGCPLVT